MLDLNGERQRRPADRRGGDRRHGSQGGARREIEERRKGSRRRQIAGAGLLAVAALAGVRSYNPRMTASGFGFNSGSQEGTVDVQEENFRLPSYDRESLEPYIQEAAAMHGVSPDLVRAVVQTESQFNPMAVSPVGAIGLMQLMPSTAKSVGLEDPFDPRQNVIAGAKYLSIMLDHFKGNTALALAGYNAGPANVRRYRGVPPFGETRGYVKKIQTLVAASSAAFSIPDPPQRSKVRRAALRAGLASSRGALNRASRASTGSSLRAGSITKTRAFTAKAPQAGRSRATVVKVRAKAPSKARGRATRA